MTDHPITRQHDLPPLWDGGTVEWRGWEPQPWGTWAFHGNRDRCVGCGFETDPIVNRGWVTFTGRRKPFYLSVFRCQECRHDTVVDLSTGTVWELGVEDYSDEGSIHDPLHTRANLIAAARAAVREGR
jgi:hypothetical protein